MLLSLVIATQAGQMHSPRAERPEIPDLNVALPSESESPTTSAILPNQESQRPNQTMKNTGIKV